MPLAEQQTKMHSMNIEAMEMRYYQKPQQKINYGWLKTDFRLREANLLLGTVLLVMVAHFAGGSRGKGLCEAHANGTFNRHIAMIQPDGAETPQKVESQRLMGALPDTSLARQRRF
jgi:hypothetical protein